MAEVVVEVLELPPALAEVVVAVQKLQLLVPEVEDFDAPTVEHALATVRAVAALLLVWLLLTGWSCWVFGYDVGVLGNTEQQWSPILNHL